MVGLSSPKVQKVITLLQPPQILNTTQKDLTRQGNRNPHHQQTERDSERGEGDLGGGESGREKTQPDKEPDPPPPYQTERDSERGEVDLWIQMDWRGELVVRVGLEID